MNYLLKGLFCVYLKIGRVCVFMDFVIADFFNLEFVFIVVDLDFGV